MNMCATGIRLRIELKKTKKTKRKKKVNTKYRGGGSGRKELSGAKEKKSIYIYKLVKQITTNLLGQLSNL